MKNSWNCLVINSGNSINTFLNHGLLLIKERLHKTRIYLAVFINQIFSTFQVLKFKKSSVAEGLNGQLINLMSNDVSKFDLAVGFFHDSYKGPIEAIFLSYFIYREIGMSGLLGVSLLICFIPFQCELVEY
jgi:hypothetical protein